MACVQFLESSLGITFPSPPTLVCFPGRSLRLQSRVTNLEVSLIYIY